MIVDDEPFNVISMQLSLSRIGIKGISRLIDRAYNGYEALTKIKDSFKSGQHIYSLVITDISMPVMDGFDEAVAIRSFYSENNVPQPLIVACTGHVEDQFIQRAWTCQIDEVLPKPVNVDNLKAIIHGIV